MVMCVNGGEQDLCMECVFSLRTSNGSPGPLRGKGPAIRNNIMDYLREMFCY